MQPLVFDGDGVLVDSEKLSCEAWLPVLARQGVHIALSEMDQFVGRSDRAVLEHHRRRTGRPLPDELIAEREREYFELAAGRVRPFPGLLDALAALRGRGARLAVASSGRPEKIRFNLSQAGLAEYFEVMCSVTQVKRGKPAPDVFLEAATQLGVRSESCVAIEDSRFGIQAARAAGMTAIGFCSTYPADQLREAGAQYVFESYVDLVPLLDEVSQSVT